MERKINFWWNRFCYWFYYFYSYKGNIKVIIDLDIKAFLINNILCFKNTGWLFHIDTMKLETVSDERIKELLSQPYKEICIPYDYVFMINHHRNNEIVVTRALKEIKMVIDQHHLNQQNASSCP